MKEFEFLGAEAANHPYPLLFASISGAHLYGFPSPDSDYDVRGAHILTLREAVGILPKRETIEVSNIRDGVEIDLVTHDALKFFNLLLTRNGYVLEQLYSPLKIQTSSEHDELKDIARKCITRNHSHHYLGFAESQWKLFQKDNPPRIKPLLYVYRVLLTGIHLMRTGQVEANLVILNDGFRLPYLAELVQSKIEGTEHSLLHSDDHAFYLSEYSRLILVLEEAEEKSQLPFESNARDALNDLLVRLRLKGA